MMPVLASLKSAAGSRLEKRWNNYATDAEKIHVKNAVKKLLNSHDICYTVLVAYTTL